MGERWGKLAPETKAAYQQLTIEWLRSELDKNPSSNLCKNSVYCGYTEFCRVKGIVPTTPSVFGKWWRIPYPKIIHRRLGRRGNVKYYYTGIDVVQGSNYIETMTAHKIIS